MKKTLTSTLSIALSLLLLVCLAACKSEVDPWDSATYLENTEIGSGEKTLVVEVKANDRSVTFTIHTNQTTVGAAMIEHQLLAGEEGAYGLYVKSVNGMVADFDVDQTYWAFYVNGEYAMTGVELTEITEGATYQLVYTK